MFFFKLELHGICRLLLVEWSFSEYKSLIHKHREFFHLPVFSSISFYFFLQILFFSALNVSL